MIEDYFMYVNIDNFNQELNLYAEYEDLCYICRNVEFCPLLAAIQQEAVVLRYESIGVDNCGMYDEFRLGELIAF